VCAGGAQLYLLRGTEYQETIEQPSKAGPRIHKDPQASILYRHDTGVLNESTTFPYPRNVCHPADVTHPFSSLQFSRLPWSSLQLLRVRETRLWTRRSPRLSVARYRTLYTHTHGARVGGARPGLSLGGSGLAPSLLALPPGTMSPAVRTRKDTFGLDNYVSRQNRDP